MTRPRRPVTLTAEERARRKRTEALEQLDTAHTLTRSQQALQRRLRALEAADPTVTRDAEVRRLLGLS